MTRKKFSRLPTKFAHYLHLQLFLTLFSWPLLVSWGIPISAATLLGNLIFAPFLSLFLFIASLIFFCELLSINNTLLIAALELLCTLWCSLLACSSKSWLIAFKAPPMIILILIPLATVLILHHKKLIELKKNMIALILLTLIIGIITKVRFELGECKTDFPCGGSQITLIHSPESTQLIDQGGLSSSPAIESWIRTSLLPSLTKKGINKIDTLVIKRTSFRSLRAVTTILESLQCKEVVLPSVKGSLNNAYWQAYCELLSTAQEHGTTITAKSSCQRRSSYGQTGNRLERG